MLNIPSTIIVPLRYETDGSIRIGETRVLLEVVVRAFQRGDSPDVIADNCSALKLNEIYAVLAYYLQNRDDVAPYLMDVDKDAQDIREKIEAKQDNHSLRQRLLNELDNASS
ncbi:MAG: DUF433 domain-containing protein [Chloroflexota bacterium]